MEKKTIDEMWENAGGVNNEAIVLSYEEFEAVMQEYGEQCRKEGFIEGRDKALEWAGNNAKTESYWISNGQGAGIRVSYVSVIKGKTAKELQP